MKLPVLRKFATSPESAGFSLLELMVGLTILVVAVGMTASAIVSISNYSSTARETSLARAALVEKIDELRAYQFAAVFADHNGAAGDDGPGAPGPGFAVPGLNVREGDPDGMVGRLVLPEDPGNALVLREDLDLPELGLPRDLNVDGAPDGFNHAGDYRMLPVQVVLEWTGKTGDSRVSAVTVLGAW